MADPIVIIGGGQAGAQGAVSLRQLGYDGPLVLCGDEAVLPYQRPPLSKAFLAGKIDADRLELRPESAYAGLEVELRLGAPARAIDAASRRVHFADGASLPYAKLLLATGSGARPVALPGAGLAGVHTLRTIADVRRIRAALQPGSRLAVVGGGYIGLEVAAVATAMGVGVTVIEAADRVMARVVAPVVSGYFEHLHRSRGVRVLTGAGVAVLEGERSVRGVRLTDGTLVEADAVLLAVGGAPNTGLAAAAGIAIGDGILVDAACRTSAPDIFAAGDCTRFPSRLYGRPIRLESVQNAIDQAKAAAGAMLGTDISYDPVPWFWSDQYETKLQIAGLADPEAEIIRDGDAGSFSVAYVRDGRLLAVDAINAPRAHMTARRAIGERWTGSLGAAPDAAPARRLRQPSA